MNHNFLLIGYGNIAPATEVGRAVTIGIAVIGIPLAMAAIGSLGRILAQLFTLIFAKLRRLRWFSRRRRLIRARAHRWSSGSSNFSVGPGASGFGTRRIGVAAAAAQASSSARRTAPPEVVKASAAGLGAAPVAIKTNINEEELEDEDEEEEIDPRTLFPLWFAVLLLLTFVLTIATLFTVSENWNYFDSAYFTIVTLATIGLGDFVPSNTSLLLCFSIVIIFGLAILNIVVELSAFKLERLFGCIQRRLISCLRKRNPH